MTRNGVRLCETQRFRVFLVSSLKNGNPFAVVSLYIIYRNAHRYLRTRTANAIKRSSALTTRPLPKQLITETATHGCAVFLVARFKIGHTRRKLPVTQTATSRFNAYLADAPGICRSIRLCSHAGTIIYKQASFVKRFSAYFSDFFDIFSDFLHCKLFHTPNRVFRRFSKPLIRVFSGNRSSYFTLFLRFFQYTVPGVLRFFCKLLFCDFLRAISANQKYRFRLLLI